MPYELDEDPTSIPFSSRLPASLAPNALARLVDQMRAAGQSLIDLTISNPTAVGLDHNPSRLADAFARVEAGRYRPDPRGLYCAREAVSSAIGGRYASERLLLTSSSSEAYSYLFKLLCDPGDAVLVPRPSYPLFEQLTALEGIEARPYRLHHAGGWLLDLHEIEALMTPRVKAVLAVSPNNPTGNYLSPDELAGLSRICAGRAALIVDEVFREYPLHEGGEGPAAADLAGGLVFALGGLSKLAGLPQLKLGWIGVGGANELCQQAMRHLELIADAYLSVSTPVQLATADLLREGDTWRARALERLRVNRRRLEDRIAREAPHCTVLDSGGGWSAVIRVPAVEREEELVLRLLREKQVLAHPGFFYDFAREAYLVLSLLVTPQMLDSGLARLFSFLSESAAGYGTISEK